MFTFAHFNFNVFDLDKSIAFYETALGFKVKRIHEADDGSFKLAFLEDGQTGFQLELTWLRERTEPYNLGDNEIHLCVQTDDLDAAYEKHKQLGCICYENKSMNVYFISDPDGYWTEIVKRR